jgi:coatomer protein complex subunit alpha (xenin)
LSSDPLAYLTAKTNSLEEVATEILEAAGLTEGDVDDIPSFGQSTLKPPPVVTSTATLNWPSLSTGESFFDRALANGNLEGGEESYGDGEVGAAAGATALDNWAKEEEAGEEIDEGGWELDADADEAHVTVEEDGEDVAPEADLGAGASPGVSETELWVRNSPFAADHISAGSFESAMQVRIYHNVYP